MATLKAGKNVWTDGNGNFTTTDTHPGAGWYPHYNERRVTGDSYLPYQGSSDWVVLANRFMRQAAQSNFQHKNSF
jgi:hypothetical protein